MSNYNHNCMNLQTLISEAHSLPVDESTAKSWASSHIAGLESYDDVKDLAFHYGIPSVEVAHHSTIRSQLLKKIVEEMLDLDSAEDDDSYDDEFDYEDDEDYL